MAKPLELEVMLPCPTIVKADACWTEIDNTGCCGNVDNPKIIGVGNDLQVTFSWTQFGNLFGILPATAQWTAEVRIENLGNSPGDPNPASKSVVINHVPAVSYTYPPPPTTVTFNYTPDLVPYKKDIMGLFVRLELTYGGTTYVHAFQELGRFLIS